GPIASAGISPSVAAARAAIAEASRVTGTGSPAEAGADYARPATASAPAEPPAASTPAATPSADGAPVAAPEARAAEGPWRVQLGAFSVRGNADRLWRLLGGLPALAGASKMLVPAGRLTKLQAGGFATRAAAQEACNRLKAAGHACLVTR
ncbi:MAG: SPOR domain-containing protein, partial [Pseudomonadota bacterium]|nr:SPOR domain-containing protein [Pseudomonadota bacterium]